MDKTALVATVPLAIGIVLYVVQAIGYQVLLHRPGLAVMVFSYACANGGLIYDALTTVNK